MLGALAAAELLAMSLWFSASAVVPQLAADWALDAGGRAWLTSAVQLGFAAGALLSAVLTLADRWPAERLLAGSALVAAVANALIVPLDAPGPALALRAVTGAALAGVYPPGMKLAASWAKADRGLAIGLLVGALTAGGAVPHLLQAFAPGGAGGLPPWRPVLLSTSLCAVLGAALAALVVRPGPYLAPGARFDPRAALAAWRDRPSRLANLGYLGHMWELYAMWAWVPVILLAEYRAAGLDGRLARAAGFAVVAAGAAGCVVAGLAADRAGRTAVTIASLVVSGGCALAAPLLLGRPLALTVLCLVWGFAVVADSAQFSAAVSELADPRYVGSALALQTALGFLLTSVTLRLLPVVAERGGWGAGLPVLAIGPALGAAAMWRLRRIPEAARLAGGRR